jgi:hypothetical protein
VIQPSTTILIASIITFQGVLTQSGIKVCRECDRSTTQIFISDEYNPLHFTRQRTTDQTSQISQFHTSLIKQ